MVSATCLYESDVAGIRRAHRAHGPAQPQSRVDGHSRRHSRQAAGERSTARSAFRAGAPCRWSP